MPDLIGMEIRVENTDIPVPISAMTATAERHDTRHSRSEVDLRQEWFGQRNPVDSTLFLCIQYSFS